MTVNGTIVLYYNISLCTTFMSKHSFIINTTMRSKNGTPL